ncbi:MAG TPA: Rab family GTPase [Saprospiraceae bacterium]|nr:Rab family GTPase [Saprospiraceae bacterium]HMQ81913.1 Rab family GTPase [Saprospiraceae bacterium]
MNSRKILLTGSFAVGKTSLFHRFLYNTFSDKYLTSIGVKVDKKLVNIEDHEIALIVWDIAGEVSQDKIPRSYFLGASAVIYVFDLSRPSTFENMESDLFFLGNILPACPIKVVGNKKDLIQEVQLESIATTISVDYFTSAKTGENVEKLFFDIGKELLSEMT